MCLHITTPPSARYFPSLNQSNLHLDSQLLWKMMNSCLFAVQWGILANRCLLLGCELGIFPLGLLCVTFLTASMASFIAAGLTDADRGPLGSGRPSKGRNWYNAIVLPRVRIAPSKFEILHVKFVFLYCQGSCEIYENLHHSKISRYTVPFLFCTTVKYAWSLSFHTLSGVTMHSQVPCEYVS